MPARKFVRKDKTQFYAIHPLSVTRVMYRQIRDIATEFRMTWNEAALTLITWGLESAKLDDDKDEE